MEGEVTGQPDNHEQRERGQHQTLKITHDFRCTPIQSKEYTETSYYMHTCILTSHDGIIICIYCIHAASIDMEMASYYTTTL